jgi:hypothetical protein
VQREARAEWRGTATAGQHGRSVAQIAAFASSASTARDKCAEAWPPGAAEASNAQTAIKSADHVVRPPTSPTLHIVKARRSQCGGVCLLQRCNRPTPFPNYGAHRVIFLQALATLKSAEPWNTEGRLLPEARKHNGPGGLREAGDAQRKWDACSQQASRTFPHP